ncbi:metabotropic glutamate receptor 3-like isoform X1 [Centruroides vittatus]|uniref:metabotropic glutamate receptor 3-like isoform X1 n=1 Tax=Centruroides vittatus TaxID=120091 RepID=UPI00350EF1B6
MHRWLRIFSIAFILPLLPMMATKASIQWPLQRMSNYSGDIMLGALFPIHERNAKFECGKLQDEGLQQLEALVFTLNKINSDPELLPGIKLGILALDSCDSTAYALEQSLDFIKGFIARRNAHDEQQFTCSDGSVPQYREGMFDRVVGVIGGQSSAVSIQLANMLRLFNVPQVSYQSTSPTLSNKEKFEYFFRTVPSDVNQAQAILDILRTFRWTYVSVVYSDTDYGNKGYEKLQDLALEYNICFSSPQSINVDHFSDADYDTVVKNLMHKTNARVVVVFADKQTARNLMAAAKRKNAITRFVWIGSDAWGGRKSVVENHEAVVEGAITVSPLLHPLSGFDDYFKKLSPETNHHNPWFSEFWEEFFHCKVSGSPHTPYNTNYPHWCSPTKDISQDTRYKQAPALHFVRDAAYAFAHALKDMHKVKCKGIPGLCANMSHINGEDLKQYLQQVSFNDESGKKFRFLPSGDAPPRYSIINYQKLLNGSFSWRSVGTYLLGDDGEAKLDLDINAMRFKFQEPSFPRSYCSEPCRIGQAKLQLEGDTCCWLCTNCSQYQYLPDEYHCKDCPLGTLPSFTKTTCIPIPEAYLNYTSPWAVGTMAFAGMGILLTAFVTLVFWAYSNTPIIKASGRELSYLLLTGIFLSFGMTFIIVAKPSAFTCGLTRFFLGFCYTLCYAAIVTKTNRIARIFNQRRRRPCQKTRYTSPQSQLIITAVLVSIEVIINTIWLLYDRPAVTRIHPSREANLLICLGSDTPSYLVGLIYPFVLIGFCTVYAFKTRKCPDGFNEARYLTFTNYTTCVIWLAFLPLFVLSTSNAIRVVTLSFLLSLSGAVQLSCLFMPKVYIALLKPEKNTKESVMCHHNRNSNLAQTSSSLGPSTPSILINGGCKEHRLSSCSSATGSSAYNTLQVPNASPYLSTVPNLSLILKESVQTNSLTVPSLMPSTLKRHSSADIQSKTL